MHNNTWGIAVGGTVSRRNHLDATVIFGRTVHRGGGSGDVVARFDGRGGSSVFGRVMARIGGCSVGRGRGWYRRGQNCSGG